MYFPSACYSHVRPVDCLLLVGLQLGTLLRSKRKLEELSTIIQESRRAH